MRINTLFPRKALVMMPVVAVAGAALGGAVARDSSVPASSAVVWFTLALCVSSWLSAVAEQLVAMVLRVDGESWTSDAIAFVVDGLFGLGVAMLVARLASMDLLEAAGAASAILFLQTIVIDKIVLRNAVGNAFVGLLQGSGGTRPEFSAPMSAAMRGDIERARAQFEHALARNPREVAAYRAYAQMLRMHARDYAGAAAVLARALETARCDDVSREAIVRELAELQMHFLNAPGRAAVILARYIDQHNESHNVGWARYMLRVAKSLMRTSLTAILAVLAVFTSACKTRNSHPVIAVIGSSNSMVAAQVATDVINRDVEPGDSIILQLHYSTSPLAAKPAIEQAVALVNIPNIMAVVGHANSSASLAAAQIYNEGEVVQIAPTTTSPLYANAGPYSFTMVPDDREQARFLASEIKGDSTVKKIAIAYANDDYGRGLLSEVKRHLAGSDIEVVTEFAHASERDFGQMDNLREELKLQRPDLLLWLSRPSPLEVLLKDHPGIPVLGSDGLESIVVYANENGVFTGVRFVRFFDPQITSPRLEAFRRAYRARSQTQITAEALYTYDAIMLIAQGIRAGARTPAALREYVASIGQRRKFEGLGGEVRFNEDGAAERPFHLAIVPAAR